jgi:two-component system, chemotaxis family, sensor kinase CheA
MEFTDVERDALMRLFFEESEEGLLAMEHALLVLEENPADAEPLKTLFRVAHTLKGNSGSLGFARLAAVTHGLEDVLARLRGGSLAVSREVIDLLLESVDVLREMLAEARR